MEQAHKISLQRWIRLLHRDIGFFAVGLTVIYCVSGILLTYRETDFLKSEQQIEKSVDPGLSSAELARALHLKRLSVISENEQSITFKNGSYSKETGLAAYTTKELPSVLSAFNALHKANSSSGKHWFTLLYACCLGFLALSSFWMYRPGNGNFKRGIVLASAGFAFAALVLVL